MTNRGLKMQISTAPWWDWKKLTDESISTGASPGQKCINNVKMVKIWRLWAQQTICEPPVNLPHKNSLKQTWQSCICMTWYWLSLKWQRGNVKLYSQWSSRLQSVCVLCMSSGICAHFSFSTGFFFPRISLCIWNSNVARNHKSHDLSFFCQR